MITRSTELMGDVSVDPGDTPNQPAGTKALGYGEGARSASFNRPLSALAKGIDQLDWVCAQESAHPYIVSLTLGDLITVTGSSAIDLSTVGFLPTNRKRVFHGVTSSLTGLSRYFRLLGEDGLDLIAGDGSPLMVQKVQMTPADSTDPVGAQAVINSHVGESISGNHAKHGVVVPKALADDAHPGDLAIIGGGTGNDGTYLIRRVIGIDVTQSFLELVLYSSDPEFDDAATAPLSLDDNESGGTIDLVTNGSVTTAPTLLLNSLLDSHQAGYNGKIFLEVSLASPIPRAQSGSAHFLFPNDAKNRRIQGYARRARGYKTYSDLPGMSLFPYPYSSPALTPHIRRSWNADIRGFRNLFSSGLPEWDIDDPSYLFASGGLPAAPPCDVALPTRIPPGSLIYSMRVPFYNGTGVPLDVTIGLLREAPRLPSVDVASFGYQITSRPEPYALTSRELTSHTGIVGVEYLEVILPTLNGYPMFYTGTVGDFTDDGSYRYTFKVTGLGSELDGIFAHGITANTLSSLQIPFMGDYLYVATGNNRGIYPIVDLSLSGSDLEIQVLSDDVLVLEYPTIGIPAIVGPNTSVSLLVKPGLPGSAAQLRVYLGMLTTISPNDSLAAGFPY